MKFNLLILLLVGLSSTRCSKGDRPFCSDIKEGLLNFETSLIKPGMDGILQDLDPADNADDMIGHEANLQTFIERINSDCDIEVSLICYACIKTFPAQSEVKIRVDSSGFSVSRTIDIRTPSNDVMSVVGIHK